MAHFPINIERKDPYPFFYLTLLAPVQKSRRQYFCYPTYMWLISWKVVWKIHFIKLIDFLPMKLQKRNC